MMQEEVIVEGIFDISNVQRQDTEIANKFIDAIAINERLKDKLSALEKEVSQYPVLSAVDFADVALPGMYVDYDAGIWDRTVEVPSHRNILPWKKYGFSMFTKGKSKNDSVMDYHGNLSGCGWRVLGVIEDSVYLIHAGIACVYYPNDRIDAASEIKEMAMFCAKEFANSYCVKEGLCATKQLFQMAQAIYGQLPDDLCDVGAPYWLATVTRYNTIAYYDKFKGGLVIDDGMGEQDIYGIRPVIILKPNVKVLSGNGSKDTPIKITM